MLDITTDTTNAQTIFIDLGDANSPTLVAQATVGGTEGNNITLAVTVGGGNITLGGANLTGGSNNVNVYATYPGPEGNHIILAENTSGRITLLGGNLAGGSDLSAITVIPNLSGAVNPVYYINSIPNKEIRMLKYNIYNFYNKVKEDGYTVKKN